MQAPLRQSRDSLMWGRLYASLMVREFRCLRSIQNLKLPSFLCTRTTALAHGLHEHRMAPILSMSCRWFLTSSNCCGGILRYRSLKGTSLLSLISCLILDVHPNSRSDRANRWWKFFEQFDSFMLYIIWPILHSR